MVLIEEGAEQEDGGDVLVVTQALPPTARSIGQGPAGQGALVRNILEAEKALQVQSPTSDDSSQHRHPALISTATCAMSAALHLHPSTHRSMLLFLEAEKARLGVHPHFPMALAVTHSWPFLQGL